MRERLETVAHALGFGCPNHNTVILDAVNFCNDCNEQMEITVPLIWVAKLMKFARIYLCHRKEMKHTFAVRYKQLTVIQP